MNNPNGSPQSHRPPFVPNAAASEGSFIIIEAHDPPTACCEAALLVCGLRTLGVSLHPSMPFRVSREEMSGPDGQRQTRVTWQWLLASTAADGVPTGDLIKRWNDPVWIAANPTHEIAVVRAALHNMGIVAQEIREAIPRAIVRRGQLSAHIPANASPARRAHLLGQLAGTIPLNKVFVEPSAPSIPLVP